MIARSTTALCITLASALAFAQTTPPEITEGQTAGPRLKGQSTVVATIGGKSHTASIQSKCPPANRPVGLWQTSFSTGETTSMEFANPPTGVKADYKHYSGKLEGSLESSMSVGIWTQTDSNTACSKEENGSKYWGEYRFSFSQAYDVFLGTWNYCGDKSTEGQWSGARDCPDKPLQPVKVSWNNDFTLFETVDYVDSKGPPAPDSATLGGAIQGMRGGPSDDPDKVLAWARVQSGWTCGPNGLEPIKDNKTLEPIGFVRKLNAAGIGGNMAPTFISSGALVRLSKFSMFVRVDLYAYRRRINSGEIDKLSLAEDFGKVIVTAGTSIINDVVEAAWGKVKDYVKGELKATMSELAKDGEQSEFSFIVTCRASANGRYSISRQPLLLRAHDFRRADKPKIYMEVGHKKLGNNSFP